MQRRKAGRAYLPGDDEFQALPAVCQATLIVVSEVDPGTVFTFDGAWHGATGRPAAAEVLCPGSAGDTRGDAGMQFGLIVIHLCSFGACSTRSHG